MAEKAKRIASDSLPAEMLRGVCLECSRSAQEVSMIATDLSMSIFLKEPAEVIESGRIVINARLLFDIISHAPGDVVRFWADYKKNMVRIRSQKSTYNNHVPQREALSQTGYALSGGYRQNLRYPRHGGEDRLCCK